MTFLISLEDLSPLEYHSSESLTTFYSNTKYGQTIKDMN